MNIEWNRVTWYSKLLSVIFLLGIVPVLAFYIGTQYELAAMSGSQVPSGNAPSILPGNVSMDSNRGSYSNSVYGYSIKYPQAWNIDATNADSLPIAPESMGGDLYISNYSGTYIDQYKSKNGALESPADYFFLSLLISKKDPALSMDPNPDKVEHLVVNGLPAVRETYLSVKGIGGETKPNQVFVIIKSADTFYDFSYGYDQNTASQSIQTAEKIIQSFRITSATNSDYQ